MKAVLASATTMIAAIILGTVAATASNLFVVDHNPAWQETQSDWSTANPLISIPRTTFDAVCTSSHAEFATITVTGVAQSAGQPAAFAATLLGTCSLPLKNVRPIGTEVMMAFTDTHAQNGPLHVADLAYDPPAASDLGGVKGPEGASVFSGPPVSRSDGHARSSLADTDELGGEPAEAAVFSTYSTTPATGVLSITVAKVRDGGLVDLLPARSRSADGNPALAVDASTSSGAATPSSVFITRPDADAGSVLPADDLALHLDAVAQSPDPSDTSAATRVLSASVSREGAHPTYESVLAAIP